MQTDTDFRAATPAVRLYSGRNALDSLGHEAARLGARRAFIVCGRTVSRATPLVARIRERLGSACAGVHDEIGKDSPLADVLAARDAARACAADLLIAVGGGSVIQATRVVAILLAEAGDPMAMITQYPEHGPAVSPKLLAPKLPIFNVCTLPTSAAHRAGSAVKNPALEHRMEFYDPKTRPAAVWWDADALATAPPRLALHAGVAVHWRALVNLGAVSCNPLVEGNRRQAFELARRSLGRVAAGDPVARLELCAAAWLQNRDADDGGSMFERHWVQRVVYAFGTALFIRHPEVAQGPAYAALTAHVMRRLGYRDPQAMAEIARALGAGDPASPVDAEQRAADALEQIYAGLGLPLRVRELGIPRESLPLLAQDALRNFNADPKREFRHEQRLLLEVLESCW
jgi:alcohol dehydrogenase class IV